MTEVLSLLPGWSCSPTALQPLADCLRPALEVRLEALPLSANPANWLDELDERLPRGGWLGGWSLGGMLAAQLAARRGGDCPGLVTVASNACFSSREDWPEAMPLATFEAFRESFQQDPAGTLKRFTVLCSRGGSAPRQSAQRLQALQHGWSPEALAAGLCLLAELDGRDALRQYAGPQLHLFGADDALVPQGGAASLQALLPQAQIEMIAAGHALPLETPELLSERIRAFILAATKRQRALGVRP
ncbi:alpha/beta fold hydrolase [Stutzerimonas kirkiae]|uniref:alpha/beta fold hydrolase n=1 Tax=Stutzerimonas kirkiae TaxID=2211392 RepID=UPI0010385709|nr:alpha/beta fold hydrolase [Stutzerimonas kirkiae]TBV04496.1 transporter [Stutzerimonas kirkiae]